MMAQEYEEQVIALQNEMKELNQALEKQQDQFNNSEIVKEAALKEVKSLGTQLKQLSERNQALEQDLKELNQTVQMTIENHQN